MKIFAVILTFLATSTVVFSSEKKTVGLWLDKVGEAYVSKIEVYEENGRFYRKNTFEDSDKAVIKELKKVKEGSYFVIDSRHGDGCIIMESGDLVLFDKDGIIRTAKPIKTESIKAE